MGKKKSNRPAEQPRVLQDTPAAGAAAPPPGVVRRNYREPISTEDTVRAEIDGADYAVIDMGSHGLGIMVPSRDTFTVGEPCRVLLHIGDNTLELHGAIAHISPSENAGEWRCGIGIQRIMANHQAMLQQFLLAHHARLFGDSTP
ncbi:MAG: PilZ domain-containing protein [Thermodesulfobacteriota bacterium]